MTFQTSSDKYQNHSFTSENESEILENPGHGRNVRTRCENIHWSLVRLHRQPSDVDVDVVDHDDGVHGDDANCPHIEVNLTHFDKF